MAEGDSLQIVAGHQAFAAPEGGTGGISVTDGTTTVEDVTSLRVPGAVSAGGAGEAIESAVMTVSVSAGEARVDRSATASGAASGAYANLDVSAEAPNADAVARTTVISATGNADISRRVEVTSENGDAIADTTVQSVDGVAWLYNSADASGAGRAEVMLIATRGGVTAGMMAITDSTSARMGFNGATPVARPEVPATPTEQDIVDALVALGLITQAA